jgi:hypothetical protein
MKPYLNLLILLSVFGCTSTKDVRPGADGIHKVMIRGEEGDLTEEEAYAQAEKYCSQQNKKIFVMTNFTQTKAKSKIVQNAKAAFKESEGSKTDITFQCK